MGEERYDVMVIGGQRVGGKKWNIDILLNGANTFSFTSPKMSFFPAKSEAQASRVNLRHSIGRQKASFHEFSISSEYSSVVSVLIKQFFLLPPLVVRISYIALHTHMVNFSHFVLPSARQLNDSRPKVCSLSVYLWSMCKSEQYFHSNESRRDGLVR